MVQENLAKTENINNKIVPLKNKPEVADVNWVQCENKNTVPHTCYLMVRIIGKRGKKRFKFFSSKTKRFGREKTPNTKQNMDKIY